MANDIAAKLAKRHARKAFRSQNRAYIEAVSGKAARRPRRKKSLSNSKLEQIRWEAFAAVIRERDKDKGCFSCPNPQAESAGHIISRRKRAIKYDERNVNGQCLYCNWADKFRAGYHDICVAAFIGKFGLETYRELAAASLKTLQESRQEILSSAWGYIQRMSDGERKDKLRKKLAPLVPVAYGGTMEEKEN